MHFIYNTEIYKRSFFVFFVVGFGVIDWFVKNKLFENSVSEINKIVEVDDKERNG